MEHKYDINLQEISKLLEITSKQVPELITNILKSLYSAEAGEGIGKAVGGLYKELIAAGVPQHLAAQMASDYMISFKDLTNVMQFSGNSEQQQ